VSTGTVKQQQKQPIGRMTLDNKIVALIVSIFLPPVAVFLKSGADKNLVINILLCLLGFIPGVLHAIWFTVLK
jgi:uncharacterized membrane protein YqaE (UPF0057 family)